MPRATAPWYAFPIDAAIAWAYTRKRRHLARRWKAMMVQKPTLHLAKGMVGVAISVLLLGALLIGMTSWKVPGWVSVTYGILILFLAYHVSAAPCLEEPDSDAVVRAPNNIDYQERLEDLTAEALANYRI
jgi:hypothetical protein